MAMGAHPYAGDTVLEGILDDVAQQFQQIALTDPYRQAVIDILFGRDFLARVGNVQRVADTSSGTRHRHRGHPYRARWGNGPGQLVRHRAFHAIELLRQQSVGIRLTFRQAVAQHGQRRL